MPWYLSMAMQVIVRMPVTMAVVWTKGTVLHTTTPVGDKHGGGQKESRDLRSQSVPIKGSDQGVDEAPFADADSFFGGGAGTEVCKQ